MPSVQIIRVQTNLMARSERKLLNWICARLPLSITPDHLTALGVAGAATVLLGYLLSWLNHGFFWLSVAGYLALWAGDSLDGSLARFRKIERPRFGFFLDHSVDAFSNCLVMLGLGATEFVRFDISLLVLTGYYMLCMFVFLKSHVTGSFQLTFLSAGPTELRMALVALTIGIYVFGSVGLHIGAQFLSVYDLLLLLTACVFYAIFVTQTWVQIMQLRASDTVPSPAVPVSSSTNPALRHSMNISDELVEARKVSF